MVNFRISSIALFHKSLYLIIVFIVAVIFLLLNYVMLHCDVA